MTGPEYRAFRRAARGALGFEDYRQLSSWLGFTTRAEQMWCHIGPPKAVAKLLRLMFAKNLSWHKTDGIIELAEAREGLKYPCQYPLKHQRKSGPQLEQL